MTGRPGAAGGVGLPPADAGAAGSGSAPAGASGRPQLAVLGSPIAHSQSPALQAAAYRVLGFEADYGSADVGSGMLAAFIDGLDSSWRGLSLTMPLKEEVLPLLDSADRMATLTSAANTVLLTPEGGRLRRDGFNTDVAGIVGALGAAIGSGPQVGSSAQVGGGGAPGTGRTQAGGSPVREVLIIGAGATARSAVVAAASLGAQHVLIAARESGRAGAAVEVAHRSGLSATVIPLVDALSRAREEQVTVSTLPGGALTPADVAALAPAPGAVLLDVAYSPWPSVLGSAWATGGGVVVSGLLMLVHQALVQVRIFVNRDPELVLDDEPAVLAAMLEAVGLPG